MSEAPVWLTPVHPAAELLPMMPDPAIEELADDIAKNGLQEPIVLWVDNTAEKDGDDCIKPEDYPRWLLDARNRLKALERRGLTLETVRCVGNAANVKMQKEQPVLTLYAWQRQVFSRSPDGRLMRGGGWRPGVDPWAYIASANLHRRHLTAEDQMKFRAAYIQAHAGDSDRKIAVALRVSHPTIAADRKRIAATGKDLPVEPAVPTEPAAPTEPPVPVADPSPAAQPRLGRDGKTRRLPQRVAKVANPATTTTTEPSNPQPSPSDVPWWQQLIDADHTPTNPDEALKLYNALSFPTSILERQADPYIVKAGKVLLHARDFFPNRRDWNEWLRTKVKTCPEASAHARQCIDWAKASRRETDPGPEAELDAVTFRVTREDVARMQKSVKRWVKEHDAWLDSNPVAKERVLDDAKFGFNRLASDQKKAFVEWAKERLELGAREPIAKAHTHKRSNGANGR